LRSLGGTPAVRMINTSAVKHPCRDLEQAARLTF
jgi:hypothetical protein